MPGHLPASAPTIEEQLRLWERDRGLEGSTRNAVYISTPISTGHGFVRWYASEGKRLEGSAEYDRALKAQVILPNVQRMARFVEVYRWRHSGLVIDPTTLDVPGWTQPEYHDFWLAVLKRHARRILFLDGWELSLGCAIEFRAAQEMGLDCVDMQLGSISLSRGVALIQSGIAEAQKAGITVPGLKDVLGTLRPKLEARVSTGRLLYKDQVLDHLAATANVAQFVSFGPGEHLPQRYSRVLGRPANHRFVSPEKAVTHLLRRSPEGKVNVRTFYPERPEDNPFERNLATVDEVMALLRTFAGDQGLHTIVNESIDIHDGGVSGVAHKGAIEFAPDSTPRCVDDQEIETALLPFELGLEILGTVYGFEPDLRGRDGARVEFSIHPEPRGWLKGHTIIWQAEQHPADSLKLTPVWPNAFSRFLGDKVFGLVAASAAGLPVPRTAAYTRRLFPFVFGMPTGSRDVWTRTCPEEKEPGYYPSVARWVDPYAALSDWTVLEPSVVYSREPAARQPAPLASVIVQQNVPSVYAGRLLPAHGGPRIAGVAGSGDRFMLGAAPEEDLPRAVERAVQRLYERVCERFGDASVEWVFDGARAWVVQLNSSRRSAVNRPDRSDVSEWNRFVFEGDALESFREEVVRLAGTGRGILVVGNVSPLSHAGEIADLHAVPARFVPAEGD